MAARIESEDVEVARKIAEQRHVRAGRSTAAMAPQEQLAVALPAAQAIEAQGQAAVALDREAFRELGRQREEGACGALVVQRPGDGTLPTSPMMKRNSALSSGWPTCSSLKVTRMMRF